MPLIISAVFLLLFFIVRLVILEREVSQLTALCSYGYHIGFHLHLYFLVFSANLALDVLNKTLPWVHLQSLVNHTARKFLVLLILNFLLLNFIPLPQVCISCIFQIIPSSSVCLYFSHTCGNCVSPVIISLP